MGFHTGHHYYALCDHWNGDRRCETSLVPTEVPDVFSPATTIVPRATVFNAVKAAGWEVTYLGDGKDRVLCPQHRNTPAKTPPADVVDVPLFDLLGGA